MKDLLEVLDVSKNFGDFQALSKVSVKVPKRSIFGLLGPNGAGKTTLIRIVNQITIPDSGQVFIDGAPLQPHHVQHIGYLRWLFYCFTRSSRQHIHYFFLYSIYITHSYAYANSFWSFIVGTIVVSFDPTHYICTYPVDCRKNLQSGYLDVWKKTQL